MRREALPGLVAWLDELVRESGVSILDLTVEGPLSAAWAIGEHFTNKVTIRFFQRDFESKTYPDEPTATLY